MQYSSPILALAATGLITTVSGHGLLTSPKPRLPGAAMEAACGQQVYNNQASDSYGNIQGELQVAATQTDYNAAECDIWLCKGYKYADNTANVQSYTAGQVVNFTFDIRAPHTGYANISIVDTASNTVIQELLYYSDFADNSKTIPANETSNSFIIPSDLGTQCSVAGACVIQHYWNAASIDQTYESCIDFTVGGSGSSSASSSTVAAASSVAIVASSVAPASSSSVAIVVSSTAAALVTSSAVPTTSSSVAAAPTTLQTIVKSSSVQAVTPTSASASVAAVATDASDYDCDDL